jgi:hypothetical protein
MDILQKSGNTESVLLFAFFNSALTKARSAPHVLRSFVLMKIKVLATMLSSSTSFLTS